MKYCAMLPLMLALSCTSPNRESQLKYNHEEGTGIIGTILGQQNAKDWNLLEGPKNINICITNDSNLDDETVLLETQLAYSYWLGHANKTTTEIENRYVFQVSADCVDTSEKYNSIIVFPGPESKNSIDIGESKIEFSRSKLFCRKIVSKSIKGQTNTSVQCSSQYTAGKGGRAHIVISKNGLTDKWVSVKIKSPAFLSTSPYLKWKSIPEIAIKGDDKKIIFAEVRKEYERLLKIKNRNLNDFKDLKGILTKRKSIAELPSFELDLIQDFKKSEEKEIEFEFTPYAPLFSTLLHEVGHQFGLLHADQTEEGALNGQSISAVLNEQNKWVSKTAVMAYGEPYLYLEEDDILGIQSTGREILKVLRENSDAISK